MDQTELKEVEALRRKLQEAKLLLIKLENAKACRTLDNTPLWKEVHTFIWGESPAEDEEQDDDEPRGQSFADEHRLTAHDLGLKVGHP